MVQYPAEYKRSRFISDAFGEPDSLIKPHVLYKRPGANDQLRCRAYAALFDKVIDPADVKLIYKAVMCSLPTGDSRFKELIETELNRKLGYACKGRARS